MNPLDHDELRIIVKDLQKQMPQIDENRIGVKHSFSQGMPKNLMDYCAVIDDKFLNNNLSIVEELHHRDSKNPIPLWFRDYQKYNFEKYEILNHDNFFKSRLNDGWRKHLSPNLTEIRSVGFFPFASMATFSNPQLNRSSQVNGSEVEVDGNTSASPNFATNYLEAGKITTITNGAYYDQMKINLTVGGGNVRLAVYDDNSSVPNNLKSESASLTAAADYTTNYAITEVQLNFTTGWLAHNQDSDTTVRWAYWSAGCNRYYRNPFTFGAMPDPFGSGTADTSSVARMKIGHS